MFSQGAMFAVPLTVQQPPHASWIATSSEPAAAAEGGRGCRTNSCPSAALELEEAQMLSWRGVPRGGGCVPMTGKPTHRLVPMLT